MKKNIYRKPSVEIIPISTENLLESISGNVKGYGDGGDLGSDDDNGAKSDLRTEFNDEDDEEY